MAKTFFKERYLAFLIQGNTNNSPRTDDTSLTLKLTTAVLERSSHIIAAHLSSGELYKHCLPGTGRIFHVIERKGHDGL